MERELGANGGTPDTTPNGPADAKIERPGHTGRIGRAHITRAHITRARRTCSHYRHACTRRTPVPLGVGLPKRLGCTNIPVDGPGAGLAWLSETSQSGSGPSGPSALASAETEAHPRRLPEVVLGAHTHHIRGPASAGPLGAPQQVGTCLLRQSPAGGKRDVLIRRFRGNVFVKPTTAAAAQPTTATPRRTTGGSRPLSHIGKGNGPQLGADGHWHVP